VVEGTEVVEEDVRREEIDVEDAPPAAPSKPSATIERTTEGPGLPSPGPLSCPYSPGVRGRGILRSPYPRSCVATTL
jgi:hypothetical protein